MIYKVAGGFVISSHSVWIPGVYDSERTARYAFRFADEKLSALQQAVNEREQDPHKRVITMEDLKKS